MHALARTGLADHTPHTLAMIGASIESRSIIVDMGQQAEPAGRGYAKMVAFFCLIGAWQPCS